MCAVVQAVFAVPERVVLSSPVSGGALEEPQENVQSHLRGGCGTEEMMAICPVVRWKQTMCTIQWYAFKNCSCESSCGVVLPARWQQLSALFSRGKCGRAAAQGSRGNSVASPSL
eukprot:m.1171129 g.1171129  ORF g.1171129 m.1171129 type:complete len:115 (-) comp24512_c0_seq2:3037-3381(-)